MIDAARASGAKALHPGYGFLSERAELAAACEDAGIVFVGPKGKSIATMGSKAEARRLMQSVGVPVVPGYDGSDQSNETLLHEAEGIGFPLLVKASAGGGGKGMKIVRTVSDVGAALESARRDEAIRRRPPDPRAIHRRAAARRVSDLRRRRRPHHSSLRARRLDPAAASEGRGGIAGAALHG